MLKSKLLFNDKSNDKKRLIYLKITFRYPEMKYLKFNLNRSSQKSENLKQIFDRFGEEIIAICNIVMQKLPQPHFRQISAGRRLLMQNFGRTFFDTQPFEVQTQHFNFSKQKLTSDDLLNSLCCIVATMN